MLYDIDAASMQFQRGSMNMLENLRLYFFPVLVHNGCITMLLYVVILNSILVNRI